MKRLQLGPGLQVPDDVVTQTLAILAVRRAGKSNAAVVLAEEMHRGGLPWVAVDPKGDWWGMRSSSDGKGAGLPVPILGGLHGDLPLQAEAGAMVADLIVAENLTCILDVSDFASKAAMLRFLADLFERLFRLHGKHPEPRHLFLEEADDYLPQRVMSKEGNLARCVGAATKIVKQGGSRGLGCTLISQRSAVVNKDALTQVETLIALRTTSPQDRAAIKGWVDYHAVGGELVESLPSLGNGEAWVISPHWLGTIDRATFRRRSTFDSGSTPTMKSGRTVATMHEIDLGALGDQMSSVVAEAEANDPKKLRARVAQLERELAQARAETGVRTEYVEVPAPIPDEVHELIAAVDERATAIEQLVTLVDFAQRARKRASDASVQTDTRSAPTARPAPVKRNGTHRPERRELPPAEVDAVHLKAGARRILETLARHHPVRHTRSQVGTLTGMKITGGTFQTYWSTLKRVGYIVEEGGLAEVTAAGLAAAGMPDGGVPMTRDEILDQWRRALKAGARRMLDVVLSHHGGIGRAQLAAALEMTATGGTFQTYLSTLRRNGLVTIDGDVVVAGDLIGAAR